MSLKVELLHTTPLEIVVKAIRKCYDSGDKSDSGYGKDNILESSKTFKLGEKDKALVKRIIDSGHHSTLEHLSYTFDLTGYSRALLQEKSRHRISSVSERSTRYCLGQLKHEEPFISNGTLNMIRAEQFLVFTGIKQVDEASVYALEALRICVVAGIQNDKSKYCLPDSLVSECIFTINARSLRNFLELRTSLRALWEIRIMAYAMFNSLPEDHKFMYEDVVYQDK